jgi:4'-phosphopantetheinyl transferase
VAAATPARLQTLRPAAFVRASAPVELDADEIQLWFFAHAGPADSAAILARVLAANLGCTAEELDLRRDEFGKPHLPARHALQFNLSHSHTGLLIGISRRQALGVDLETARRRRPVLALAQRFFHPLEAAALQRLDPARRDSAFLDLWTCKEAVVKAIGRGIGFGLDRLVFALDADGVPHALNVIDATAGPLQEWHIVRLLPAAGHFGALAWRGPRRMIRAFVAPA